MIYKSLRLRSSASILESLTKNANSQSLRAEGKSLKLLFIPFVLGNPVDLQNPRVNTERSKKITLLLLTKLSYKSKSSLPSSSLPLKERVTSPRTNTKHSNIGKPKGQTANLL